jgi:hypothetical protein
MKVGNKFSEILVKFGNFQKTWTIQNSIQGEIKSRMKSANPVYHSTQILLFSIQVHKNYKH